MKGDCTLCANAQISFQLSVGTGFLGVKFGSIQKARLPDTTWHISMLPFSMVTMGVLLAMTMHMDFITGTISVKLSQSISWILKTSNRDSRMTGLI